MPNRLPNEDDLAQERVQGRSFSYDALWERVDNQGRAIRALGEETASQFRDFRADTARTFSEITASIKALDVKMDASAKSSAEAGRPQYAALIGGMLMSVGVAVTIIQWQTSIHDKPIDDKLTFLAAALTDVNKTAITRSEYLQSADLRNRLSDLQDKFNSQLRDRMQAQLDKVEESEVTRSEHDSHWKSQVEQNTMMQNEIVGLNGRLDSLAPASDVLKRMMEREHDLEVKVYGGPK